jgi:TonB family protein
VVAPPSNPSGSGKLLSAVDRNTSPSISSGRSSGSLDASAVLSSLSDLIIAGNHRLEPMLATITDAAWRLSGASGAALAMWKEGAMVCRARSGDTAPVLGARLSANTGISGECLRTGKVQHCVDTENNALVDVDVCRNLGLRSMVVLPIRNWRGVNGILEVFSTRPAAFTEEDIALLQRLATLAENARASQPHDALPAAPKLPPAIETRRSVQPPASDRVGDIAFVFMGGRRRPLLLGAIGLAAISLLALAIWLGWRGPDGAESKLHPVTAPVAPGGGGNGPAALAANQHADGQRPDGQHSDDPVWKPNPGGETLFSSNGKPSAGAPVKFASNLEVIVGNKAPAQRSPLLADVANKISDKAVASAALHPATPNSQTGAPIDSPTELPAGLQSSDAAAAEPPSIPVIMTNASPLNAVLSAKASLPSLAMPLSVGVSGGKLVHRVDPVYPMQASAKRLQGMVILSAMIMEDGSVSDIKVVAGPPPLAQSAVEAVKQWRYKPYELDGKPVKNEIRIDIDFRFPGSLNH